MKIAIVGKGGSGKTTLATLLSLYADQKEYRVGLFDVDVNSHTADLLGLDTSGLFDMSRDAAAHDIRQFLAGTNPRVTPELFMKTTPPGTGSGQFTLDASNHITARFGQKFGIRSHIFTAGSYKPESIGLDCHHGTQSIAENLLTHYTPAHSDAIIIDSVAGNDAFGNSLYDQDMLVYILRPDRESLTSYRRFVDLAAGAGIGECVFALGNQMKTSVQHDFLVREVGAPLLGVLPVSEQIIDDRLEGIPLGLQHVDEACAAIFDTILARAVHSARDAAYYYERTLTFHRKLAQESWVRGAYNDHMEDQIDPLYKP